MKVSDEMTGRIELLDPDTKAIIQAYIFAENEEINAAVYRPLERRYPSLKGSLDELIPTESGYDFIPFTIARKEAERLRIVLSFTRTQATLLAAQGTFKFGNKEDTIMAEIKATYESLEHFVALQEQFYIDAAEVVKEIALSEGIEPIEVVRNQQHRDDVIKSVFPVRERAQNYFEMVHQVRRVPLTVGKELAALCERVPIVGDEDLLEIGKLAPTKKAMNALEKAELEHLTSKLDRIYATR